jgi:hypothetical protein
MTNHDSKEQQKQQMENKRNKKASTDPTAKSYDKKTDGVNRPAD